MQRTLCALVAAATAATALLAFVSTEADARPGYRRGGPVVVYSRRPAWRYYYAAPLIAAPAVVYSATPSRRYTCAQLEYRCDKGDDWACGVLDRDPNC